jgi:hypothetical protein
MVPPFTSPAISAIAHSASSRIRKIAVSDIIAEPVGAGNGGLAGSFVSVVFSIVIDFRAAPDLFR